MKCRVCGCTDWEPCISAAGETCAWIADDLCDFCEDEADDDQTLVELYTGGDLNRAVAARRES